MFAILAMIALSALSPELLERAAEKDPALVRAIYARLSSPLYQFEPRPDLPEEHDEQTGFLESKAKFAVCLGGTGSGKTWAAAHKTARYVLENLPHRPRCPFWIVGETYEQTCAVCWDEKLSHLIPNENIHGIDWYKQGRNWPNAVTLRHPLQPSEPGWVLEFKSYAQGRQNMQGRSIGGYWFNEEVPYEIVQEVQGRCRDYGSPGWADFTPIEVVSPQWPDLYEDPPEGWEFFHLNVEKNKHIDQDWTRRFLDSFPEEERETRRIGVFGTFTGQVFKEFQKKIHCISAQTHPELFSRSEEFVPKWDWKRIRSIDFGFNNPFCCLWTAKDHDGRYIVYDEHYTSQKLNEYHAEQIKKRWWDPSSLACRGNSTYSDHDAQQRAEFKELGIYCTPANKNIVKGISILRRMMMVQKDGKPRLYIVADKCPNLIREIRGYRWPEGTSGKNPNDLPLDKDNHAIDALRYGIVSEQSGSGSAPKPVKREWKPSSGVQLKVS